jgi:hypothetical protein
VVAPASVVGVRSACVCLVLSRWDYDILHRALNDLWTHAEGDNWEQIATKLSRYGSWEFTDFRETKLR